MPLKTLKTWAARQLDDPDSDLSRGILGVGLAAWLIAMAAYFADPAQAATFCGSTADANYQRQVNSALSTPPIERGNSL